MGHRTVHLEVVPGSPAVHDLAAGGAFVHGCELQLDQECELVVIASGQPLHLAARVVLVDGAGGVGLALRDFDAALRDRIARHLELLPAPQGEPSVPDAPAPAPLARSAVTELADALGELVLDAPEEAAPEQAAPEQAACEAAGEADAEQLAGELGGDSESRRAEYRTLQQRLRGLSLAEQMKKARTGEQSERILLERLYGKHVWEPLLRNPRITPPEVARIARMGALPRPLIEVIVGNAGWLQVPEVRRALLSNPRLATDQILRVLRLLPKHELKLVATQTVYPFAVRDAAKRLVRGT